MTKVDTQGKTGTLSVQKVTGNQAKIVIPATVVKDGYTFKVTAIESKAFWKNKKLTSITIGENITSIGKQAFFRCSKLKAVIFKGTKAPTIGKKAFKGIKAKCTVTVPKKMKKKQLNTLKKRMKSVSAGSKLKYKKK